MSLGTNEINTRQVNLSCSKFSMTFKEQILNHLSYLSKCKRSINIIKIITVIIRYQNTTANIISVVCKLYSN